MPFHHRRWRFHGLKKPKIRQDWNKHTLYNLSRLTMPNTASRTFFQQKWTAKAATRAYHGEQIKETQWKRMFDRRTPAVVPMDPKALAEDDGSFHSAGRGSGKQAAPSSEARDGKKAPAPMPYMQMVYHPTERRLDTAIFRALFASSARQARQFVTHGHVKVNGKKMIYPGYLLNPGDMFQVDPESVLTSTGKILKRTPGQTSTARDHSPATAQDPAPTASPIDTVPEPQASQETPEEQDQLEDDLTPEELEVTDTDPAPTTKRTLLALRTSAMALESHPPGGSPLSAKQKQDLRAFRKTLKSSLSHASSLSPSALEDLEASWAALSARLTSSSTTPETDTTPASPPSKTPPPSQRETLRAAARAPPPADGQTAAERELAAAAGFWTPKPYMSAFAFVPRYLEVNQAVCSAVYLRHPVVKPGLAEVPTPFHAVTGQLAFNWYLRRR